MAVLNDCKYGHDIKEDTIRLTLLKSAVEPDYTADLGTHSFTYAILPHSCEWYEAGICLLYTSLADVKMQMDLLDWDETFVQACFAKSDDEVKSIVESFRNQLAAAGIDRFEACLLYTSRCV